MKYIYLGSLIEVIGILVGLFNLSFFEQAKMIIVTFNWCFIGLGIGSIIYGFKSLGDVHAKITE